MWHVSYPTTNAPWLRSCSRTDQHTEQQEIALHDAGCERVFVDRGISGSIANRPAALDQLLEYLRADDVVAVPKLDRLGLSLEQILDFVKVVESCGARLVSLVESAIDTTSAAGKLVFQIFAVVAEFERERLRERTMEGFARAKANGTRLGRRPAMTAAQIEEMRALRRDGRSYQALARTFKVSRSTARLYCQTEAEAGG